MPRKNLLSLHEAIVIALINFPSRKGTFQQLAAFIEKRDLYPNRKGNIPLSAQIMLRTTKSSGAYAHLFRSLDDETIELK